MDAILLDRAGQPIMGPALSWVAGGEDRLATAESQRSNIWTVRGPPEVHTLTVHVKDRPEVGARYHVRVFDQKLRLRLEGTSVPTVMTVGENLPIHVRLLTQSGAAVPEVNVSFLMNVVGWLPCGWGACPPPFAGTIVPAQGWTAGDQLSVLTDQTGVAAAVFTADTLLYSVWTGVSYRLFDAHVVIGGITGLPAVADTVFGRVRLLAGAAARIFVESGETQGGSVGTTLADPFWIKVTDRYNNPVASEPVAWTVVTGGGSLVWTSAGTDDRGRAGARLMLGPEPGPQRVVASIAAGANVTFTAMATE
jgi:hypothetical protein